MFIYRNAEDMIKELRQEIERNIKRQDAILEQAKGARSQEALIARGSRAAYQGMLSLMEEGSYQFREEQPQVLKMDDPLSQDCPTCGALAGKPCRTSSLREQRAIHARRISTHYEPAQPEASEPRKPSPSLQKAIKENAAEMAGYAAREAAATEYARRMRPYALPQAERALQAGCPLCSAEPGSYCTNVDGSYADPHQARIEASML